MTQTFTHRDVFRLVHPEGVNQAVGNFILKGEVTEDAPGILHGFNRMQKAGGVKEVIAILNEYKNLPWETIPTQFLNDADVWKTLFYNGALGQTALIRNITRFAKNGALNDLKFAGDVAKALADKDRIVKGRVHPVAYANALGIYSKGTFNGGYGGWGYGNRNKDWNTNAKVMGGLESGFYESFATVEAANVPTMVSVDVSGSMTWAAPAGLVGLDCLEASALMAMVAVRSEPYVMVNAFSTSLKEVNVSDNDSLDTVVKKFKAVSMGGTDCSAPMVYAKAKKLDIDSFQVYTDSETWAGTVKPARALADYRKASGRNAKLAVVAMAGTDFTIADKNDRGMLDFVGFDSTAPKVMADFAAGRI